MLYSYWQTLTLKKLTNRDKSSKSPWIAHHLRCILTVARIMYACVCVKDRSTVYAFVFLHCNIKTSKELCIKIILNARIARSSFHNTKPRHCLTLVIDFWFNFSAFSSLFWLIISIIKEDNSKQYHGMYHQVRYQDTFLQLSLLSRKGNKNLSSPQLTNRHLIFISKKKKQSNTT